MRRKFGVMICVFLEWSICPTWSIRHIYLQTSSRQTRTLAGFWGVELGREFWVINLVLKMISNLDNF